MAAHRSRPCARTTPPSWVTGSSSNWRACTRTSTRTPSASSCTAPPTGHTVRPARRTGPAHRGPVHHRPAPHRTAAPRRRTGHRRDRAGLHRPQPQGNAHPARRPPAGLPPQTGPHLPQTSAAADGPTSSSAGLNYQIEHRHGRSSLHGERRRPVIRTNWCSHHREGMHHAQDSRPPWSLQGVVATVPAATPATADTYRGGDLLVLSESGVLNQYDARLPLLPQRKVRVPGLGGDKLAGLDVRPATCAACRRRWWEQLRPTTGPDRRLYSGGLPAPKTSLTFSTIWWPMLEAMIASSGSAVPVGGVKSRRSA